MNYCVDFYGDFIVRTIDCPFEVIQVYYTKSNSLFIEAADGPYAFNEKGFLIKIPDDIDNRDEVWEDMVNVDSFLELDVFSEEEENDRRLVGITLLRGVNKGTMPQLEHVLEMDARIGHKPVEGVAKANTRDNANISSKVGAADVSLLPFIIVAGRDVFLYPDNIYIKNILPEIGKVGVGGSIFAGNRVIAVYKNE